MSQIVSFLFANLSDDSLVTQIKSWSGYKGQKDFLCLPLSTLWPSLLLSSPEPQSLLGIFVLSLPSTWNIFSPNVVDSLMALKSVQMSSSQLDLPWPLYLKLDSFSTYSKHFFCSNFSCFYDTNHLPTYYIICIFIMFIVCLQPP